MIKWTYNIIKHFIVDLWKDIKFLFVVVKKVLKHEQIVDPEKWADYKAWLKTLTPDKLLIQNAHWIIAIVFAVVMGVFLSSQYYQVKCNNFIIENYVNKLTYGEDFINPNLFNSSPVLPFVTQSPNNPSHENSEYKDYRPDNPVNP